MGLSSRAQVDRVLAPHRARCPHGHSGSLVAAQSPFPAAEQYRNGLYQGKTRPKITNDTLIRTSPQLYAALVSGTCVAALLCFGLAGKSHTHTHLNSALIYGDTEFLPGKRALAIALCIYHATCSTVLFNAPRFIPHSFGSLAES